jgi:hypothetical protein
VPFSEKYHQVIAKDIFFRYNSQEKEKEGIARDNTV